MRPITVQLLKPHKDTIITYSGELLHCSGGHAVVRARWERDRLDLGFVTFEPGDEFLEHFYTDRWYNVFRVRSATGTLKGWYCNLTRPAELTHATLSSEDLELDVFVTADRQSIIRLDEEDFERLNLDRSDPAAFRAVMAALHDLEALARRGAPPFDEQ